MLIALQMESISMHNALMLLGEEGLSSTAKQGNRVGKRLSAGAASTGNKNRKTAAHKEGAEYSRSAKAKVWVFMYSCCASLQHASEANTPYPAIPQNTSSQEGCDVNA